MPKACSSRSMYLCICHFAYLYVCNTIKVAKNQVLANAVHTQRNNISNKIVLDFLNIKALFTIYGMIGSP